MNNRNQAFAAYMAKEAGSWYEPWAWGVDNKPVTEGTAPIQMPDIPKGYDFGKQQRKYKKFVNKATDVKPIGIVEGIWSPKQTRARVKTDVTQNVSNQLRAEGFGAQQTADELQQFQDIVNKNPALAKNVYVPGRSGWDESKTRTQAGAKEGLADNKTFQSVGKETEKHTPQGWWRRNKDWLLPAGIGVGGLGLLAMMLMGMGGGGQQQQQPIIINAGGRNVRDLVNGWNQEGNFRGNQYRGRY